MEIGNGHESNNASGYIFIIHRGQTINFRAVVVAQLVERSLPIPEVCGSNPDIGILFILNICFLPTVY